MIRSKCCWLIVFAMSLTLMFFASKPATAQQLTVAGFKKNFDADNDGLIQKSEAKNQLLKNFERIDTNGDDVLDDAELKKLVEQLRRRNNGPRSPASQFVVPDSVKLTKDVVYREGDSDKWKLDLYVPADKESSAKKRPAIVFVHGGGWRSGDKGGGQWRSQPIAYAQKGYVCISINYRLLDEAKFPACIEDCKNAVRWLRANADKHGVDSDRIGAYGNSAGAHLVSVLGLTGEDKDLEGDGPYQEFSSAIQAVVCSAPPTNFMNWDGKTPTDGKLNTRLFGDIDMAKAKEMAAKCSPITHAKKGVPFLVIHGTADRTVPIYQGDCFVEALKKAEADVTYIRVDGAGHGVFGQAAKKTQPAMETFFEQTLNQPSE
ncbi:MAG: alpha/beta hydrolase [Planctomycetota bacterium]